MAFLSTTSDLLVLERVNKTVDTLLMQVKCFLGTILKRFKFVHVNKTVQRRGHNLVQILIVLNLGDPTPMGMHF